jgi:hypothetical protein
MKVMTKEQLAKLLNGREIGDEMDGGIEIKAKLAELVVVYGASDDLCEFRGAINDERGCYDGGEFYITPTGPMKEHTMGDCDCAYCGYEAAKAKAKKIEAVWGEKVADVATGKKVPVSWTYKTDIPHATFDIMEDGALYCRGIIFDLSALSQ